MYKCPKIPSPHYFKSSLLTLPLISTSSCISNIFLSMEVNWCRSDISQYVKLVKIKPYMSFLFYLTWRLQAPMVIFYYSETIETARASPLVEISHHQPNLDPSHFRLTISSGSGKGFLLLKFLSSSVVRDILFTLVFH